MSDKTNFTDFFDSLGCAIIILFFFLGIGGCSYLESKGAAKIIESRAKADLAKQVNASVLQGAHVEVPGNIEKE